MKWNHNGIKYHRGCYIVLIAQFDGKGNWWEVGAMCTQQSMRAGFKRLGEYLGSKTCEVKRLYDDEDNPNEKSVSFWFGYDGKLYVSDDSVHKFVPYRG